MKIISIVVGVVGAVILIVAAVLGFRVLPDYIDRKIEEEISLYPQSETWEKWIDIDKPLYLDVYVFNITNPDGFEISGDYPDLFQLGPYSYRQRRRKVNLTQTDGERSVTYEQKIYYTFDQERSGNNSETDLINILNVPFVLIISAVAKALGPGMAALIANMAIPTEKLLRRNVPVGDLIFNGMDTSIYTELAASNPGLVLPSEFDGGRFGIYKGRNGSTDGVYKVHTGVGDSSRFGEIILWNGKSDLGFWNPLSSCDKIHGTDGTIFPPFVKKDRRVEIFSSDLCRSLYLNYEKEVKVKDIKGYRFSVSNEVLEDPRINSNNRCFCNQPDVEECLLAGVVDISACRSGAPFVLSTPYFLGGNENYSVDSGLWPSKALHDTFLDIEPNTGVLLAANKRIQINLNYKKIPAVFAMENAMEMIFPIMWIDENVQFTDANAQELKDKLLNPKKAVVAWRWVGVGVGIALIFIAAGMFIFFNSRNRRTSTINLATATSSAEGFKGEQFKSVDL